MLKYFPWRLLRVTIMTILIIKNGQMVIRVDESNFENEIYLQNYIAENPELIPLRKFIQKVEILL